MHRNQHEPLQSLRHLSVLPDPAHRESRLIPTDQPLRPFRRRHPVKHPRLLPAEIVRGVVDERPIPLHIRQVVLDAGQIDREPLRLPLCPHQIPPQYIFSLADHIVDRGLESADGERLAVEVQDVPVGPVLPGSSPRDAGLVDLLQAHDLAISKPLDQLAGRVIATDHPVLGPHLEKVIDVSGQCCQ